MKASELTAMDNLIKQAPFFCHYCVGATLSIILRDRVLGLYDWRQLLEAGQRLWENHLHPLVAISGCDLSETLSLVGSGSIDAHCPGNLRKEVDKEKDEELEGVLLLLHHSGRLLFSADLIWNIIYNMHLVFSAQALVSSSSELLSVSFYKRSAQVRWCNDNTDKV